jgi:branched-chain amino acid transport system permease protein
MIKIIWSVVGALIVVLALWFPQVASKQLLTVGIMLWMYSYMSLSWNLAFGYCGVFSMGHSVLMGIGAYTSTMLLLKAGLSPWLGMLVGGVVSAVFAALFSMVAFRFKVKGLYFALLSFGLIIVFNAIFNSWDYVGGPVGLVIPFSRESQPTMFLFGSRAAYYHVMLAMTLVMVGFTYWVSRSRLGYFLVAIREDEDIAAAIGVNVFYYKVLIMAISGFFVAFGGTFYAQYFMFIDPGTLFSMGPMVQMQLGTMVGGAGTVVGPIVGSTVYIVIEQLLRSLPFDTRQAVSLSKVVYGVALMAIIFYIPGGLMSVFKRRLSQVSTHADKRDRKFSVVPE